MTVISILGRRSLPLRCRRHVNLLMAIVISVALVQPADGAAAGAKAPVRSGTIAVAATWGIRGPSACSANADCAAWLASHCARSLAERDPAIGSSIVDVASLAGERTLRMLTYTKLLPRPVHGGQLVIEFWGGRCEPMGWDLPSYRFKIPAHARWMTVSAGGHAWMDIRFVGTAITWNLR